MARYVQFSGLTLILVLFGLVHCQRNRETDPRTTTENWFPRSSTSPRNSDKLEFERDRNRTPRPYPNIPDDFDFDRSTTTTRRSWPPYQTTTTERNFQDWTTTRKTTTVRPPPPIELTSSPTINFTVLDSSGKILDMDWVDNRRRAWNMTSKSADPEATIFIQNLRQIDLILVCNASYPIEWLSRNSYGTDEWEMEELRMFPKGGGNSHINVLPTYSLILRLSYDKGKKEATIPKKQEFICGGVKTRGPSSLRKRTLLEIEDVEGGDRDALKAKIFANVKFNETVATNLDRQEFDGELGKNVKCNLNIEFVEVPIPGKFVCHARQSYNEDMLYSSESSESRRKVNLTIDYQDKCYDFASCRRRFSETKCGLGSNFPKTGEKTLAPSNLWQVQNPPASGVVFCKVDGNKNANETVAMSFFHSLPPLCPQDEKVTRRQLYVFSQTYRPDLYILERDFVSFCPTSALISEEESDSDYNNLYPIMGEGRPPIYTIYSGENITISCIYSVYHFARGTRIKLKSGFVEDYVQTFDTSIEKLEGVGRGYYNFTAKVKIRSQDDVQLYCENYLKRSGDSVKKALPIEVKSPRKIKIKTISNPLTQWLYYGQPNFQLRCEADGDPVPSIRWKKGGKVISSHGPLDIESGLERNNNGEERWSVLRFPTLDEDRRSTSANSFLGTYTCEAFNKLDTAEAIFNVVGSTNVTNPVTVVIDESGKAVPVSSEGGGGDQVLIISIVVPIILLLAIGIIGFLVWKIKKQGKKLMALTKAEVDEFILGKPEFLQHHSSSEEVNNYAPYLPYNKSYEIGKEQLELDENAVIGSGAYAVVLKGTLTSKRNGEKMKVAIKTAKPMDDLSFFKALLSELKIMGFIGTHPNIVNLVGAHTKNIQNREVFICIELCENGNLLTYLRENRHRFTNLIGARGNIEPDMVSSISRNSLYPGQDGVIQLNTITLIKWAQEVATGMEFLSAKKVIHGDLAARNILLNQYLVAKIGDFGLSRQLFEYTNYIKKQQSPLPWKWLAVECLQDMRFSVKSDVWAYSILLYETFSLGQVPYPGYSYNEEFLDALIQGKRPNKPAYASKEIFELMERCWRENPGERPSFSEIRGELTRKLQKLLPQEYLELQEKINEAATPPIELSHHIRGQQGYDRQGDVKYSSRNETLTMNRTADNEQQRSSRFSLKGTKALSNAFHRS